MITSISLHSIGWDLWVNQWDAAELFPDLSSVSLFFDRATPRYMLIPNRLIALYSRILVILQSPSLQPFTGTSNQVELIMQFLTLFCCMRMLAAPEGNASIHWLPLGDAFEIIDSDAFGRNMLPAYQISGDVCGSFSLSFGNLD